MRGRSNCDTCVHYIYDDELGYYVCEVNLDEDEMQRFLQGQTYNCPYYDFYDEYGIVRKQN